MSQSKVTKAEKRATMKRLRGENRWTAACDFRAELRNEGKSASESWAEMEAKFPPQPQPETTTDLPDLGGAGDEPENEGIGALLDKLGSNQPDYAQDVLWTYSNLDNHRVLPEDAPGVGAWAMLKWAKNARNRFFEQLLPKAMAEQAKKADEDENEEDLCDKTVRKLLIEIQEKANRKKDDAA